MSESSAWIQAQWQIQHTLQVYFFLWFFYYIHILKFAQHCYILENWSFEAFRLWFLFIFIFFKDTRRWVSTVVSILATLTNSYQPHAVALQGIIFIYTAFWKDIHLPYASVVLSFSCSPSLCLSVSYKHTLQHAHNQTCTTPLKTGSPPIAILSEVDNVLI